MIWIASVAALRLGVFFIGRSVLTAPRKYGAWDLVRIFAFARAPSLLPHPECDPVWPTHARGLQRPARGRSTESGSSRVADRSAIRGYRPGADPLQAYEARIQAPPTFGSESCTYPAL